MCMAIQAVGARSGILLSQIQALTVKKNAEPPIDEDLVRRMREAQRHEHNEREALNTQRKNSIGSQRNQVRRENDQRHAENVERQAQQETYVQKRSGNNLNITV